MKKVDKKLENTLACALQQMSQDNLSCTYMLMSPNPDTWIGDDAFLYVLDCVRRNWAG